MLARFNPKDMWTVGPLRGVHGEFERMLRDFRDSGTCVVCAMDVREDDGHFYVDADLPGFAQEDVEVTLEDNVLTIRGEKRLETDKKEYDYHIRERRAGSFNRQVQLPPTIDASTIHARLNAGVLAVTVEKKPEVRPRKIDIQVK